MSFKFGMEEAAKKTGSSIVLAFDLPPNELRELFFRAKQILEAVHVHICAVKLNRHLILPLGLFGDVQELVNQAKGYGLPIIMDCKINDIGNTNRIIAEYYFKAGFDAVTANPFVGWEEGLQPVFETAKRVNRGVILLVYMSHKGAWEGYGQRVFIEKANQKVSQYRVFAQKALEWGADGVVVGATYPEKIKEVFSILGEKVPIYSPGIGAQGGNIEDAVRSGAKYLIVGRAITLAENPSQVAEDLKLVAQKSLKKIK
ncbi:MAG: orotidine-5'-phosphate decarboxylase [Candidatus Bathyarchaeota archaeon]|nr:orotidine-5'-phosphate decarboxylase [Candidatus Bathyarchaeota archaeon]MDH5494948.1 orotidine-5'-phosphate decarboxylase [Candidatus Bathyarchaeota archaeon]